MELLIGSVIGLAGVVLAYLSYRHDTDSEPWKLTKVGEDLWELERLHKQPVWIVFLLNFHGTEVQVANDAAFPAGVFRKGRKIILRISPSQVGTRLDVFYRPVTGRELRAKLVAAPEGYNMTEGLRCPSWDSPIY